MAQLPPRGARGGGGDRGDHHPRPSARGDANGGWRAWDVGKSVGGVKGKKVAAAAAAAAAEAGAEHTTEQGSFLASLAD